MFISIERRGAAWEVACGERSAAVGHRIDLADGEIDGVYAGWRWEAGRLTVDTDRYGLYPLYAAADDGRWTLATTVDELLALGAPRALDHDALSVFLRVGFFVEDDTPFSRDTCLIAQAPGGRERPVRSGDRNVAHAACSVALTRGRAGGLYRPVSAIDGPPGAIRPVPAAAQRRARFPPHPVRAGGKRFRADVRARRALSPLSESDRGRGNRRAVPSPSRDLPVTTPSSVTGRVVSGENGMSTASGEWRIDGLDERTFAAAVRRAQGEFLEMPGLRLSEAEAARLWSLDATLCSAVLSELVKSRFLVRTRRALFVRP